MRLDLEAVRRDYPEVGEVRAGLLFGSRALGTHRPDSDADVLLLSETATGAFSLYFPGNGMELHLSVAPLATFLPEPPPKWWQPLAGAVSLGLAPARETVLVATAARLWADAERRQAWVASLLAPGARLAQRSQEPASLEDVRLREAVDGRLSLRCFAGGRREPGKPSRLQGWDPRWGTDFGEFFRQALELTGDPRRVQAALLSWPGYREFVQRHLPDPFHRSVASGPPRWERDTARALAAGQVEDAAFYLGFVLDRVTLAAHQAGVLSELQQAGWYQQAWQALRGRTPGTRAPPTALAAAARLLAGSLG